MKIHPYARKSGGGFLRYIDIFLRGRDASAWMIMSNEHCACARTKSEIDDFSHVKPHRIAAALLDNLAFDQFIVSVECGNANVFLIQPEQSCAKEIACLASSRQILTICPVRVYVVDVDSENVGQICKNNAAFSVIPLTF